MKRSYFPRQCWALSGVLIGMVLLFALAASAQAPSIEGTYQLISQTLSDGTVLKPPAIMGDFRRQSEIERRPIPGQMLARWQTHFLRPRNLAGEEFSLAGPALLAARQLALRWRIVLVGHIGTGYSWRCIADACLVSRIVA